MRATDQIRAKMAYSSNYLLHNLAILLLTLLFVQSSLAHLKNENGVKTDVFLSPEFALEPGSVSDKYYYNIDFPRGHIAIKGFNAEVIDEKGNPVPLHETYLHHWVLLRYYYRKGVNEIPKNHHATSDLGFKGSDHIVVKNSGICDNGLTQYYGLGSETRRTDTDVPEPYGIEIGNVKDIPEGYEEGWILNVHAIDTRGAVDKLGCTECRCDLYNMTTDKYGVPLPENYVGGLKCCYDEVRCKVKDGFRGIRRSLYMRYTVKYADWSELIVPVKIYILDVTDLWTRADQSRGLGERHHCLVEYDVKSCPIGEGNDACTHTKTLTVNFPSGGDVIYGVGHQHTGGIGTTLYGEGGREICSSNPTYGEGDEPGNEAGYIVGMSTCYPSPGSIKISNGETLTFVSKYSSGQKRHTGVMGLFYLLIADSSPKPNPVLQAPAEAHKSMMSSNFGWAIALFGVGLVVVVLFVTLRGGSGRGEGYEAIV